MLEQILNNLSTYTTIYIIGTTLFMFVSVFMAKQRQSKHVVPYSIFTMLGMLGTFLGVCLGLYGFDTKDIDNSVITLLGGLQTSFLTSIAGIIQTIVYRYLSYKVYTHYHHGGIIDAEALSVEDLLAQVITTNNANADQLAQINSSLQNNNHEIAQQLQVLNDNSSENARLIQESLEKFSSEVVGKSVHAIVQELQQIVENFNNEIQTQVGDSFKEFSTATIALVQWQQQYKEFLEQYQSNNQLHNEAIVANKEAMERLSKSLKVVSKHTEYIPKNIQKLEGVIEEQHKHLDESAKLLGSLQVIREQATDAIPALTSLVNASIKQSQRQAKELAENTNDILTEVYKKSDEDFQRRVKDILHHTSKSMVETSAKLTQNYTEISDALVNLSKQIHDLQAQKK